MDRSFLGIVMFQRTMMIGVWAAVLAHPLSVAAQDQAYGYGSLPKGAWACLGSPRFVSDNPARILAFSPDGKYLATGTAEFSPVLTYVHIWDVTTGEELHVLKGHLGQIVGLRFTPDSKTLLSAGWHGDQSVIVWDVATGKEQRRFKGHTAVITCMDLTRDGKHLITSSQDGTLRIWDYAEGKEIRSLKYGGAKFTLAAAWSFRRQRKPCLSIFTAAS